MTRTSANTAELVDIAPGVTCMTEYLIVTRAAIVLWVNLAVMPVELVFDAIEAELERRGIEHQPTNC
jgi:hypothetical protein